MRVRPDFADALEAERVGAAVVRSAAAGVWEVTRVTRGWARRQGRAQSPAGQGKGRDGARPFRS